ncbi:hypothetical protein [Streptomyces sp. AcE210]|uniref:hypothetical protein n=1 Tax=Streptomyces sp. AcE210 TaxID=2292703 RepID=UPI000E30A74D|nr:hypothetical protein [Streptomyces sp. AcE210]RFC77830.1 hypothetical protein DXZ75_08300 [Streptomyces sp. AcE210]
MPSQSAETLRLRYVEQAASDLKENRRRQKELSEKLKMLKQEEALLTDILSLTERLHDLAEASPLPEQAQDEATFTRGRPSGKPATANDGKATGGKTRRPAATRSAKSSGKAGTQEKQRQPLLGELLTELLAASDEPQPAKELRDELLEKHPDRTPTPQVVRNTLEALVAKGRIRRHRQQRSVMYTLVRSDAQ